MEKENTTLYGFDLKREQAEQDGTEWPLGSIPSCIAEIPEEQRAKYLPQGEVQRTAFGDLMDCATRGPINILECKFNFLLTKQLLSLDNELWLRENGYVDDGVKSLVFSLNLPSEKASSPQNTLLVIRQGEFRTVLFLLRNRPGVTGFAIEKHRAGSA